jgi:undecaprenyl-diphosphatase
LNARRDGDLVREPFRGLVVAGILFAAFAVVVTFVAVDPSRPPLLDGIDRSWRDLALRAPAWSERVSEILRPLGSGIVMVPLRIAVAIWLLVRRRRFDLAAWLLAWALADAIAIALKPAIGRAHPDGGGTSSFPSAHAKTAAQVAVGLVLVATNASGRRAMWWILALAWVVAMAASRTVLDEHWLSDVVAGSLLGAGCAVGSAAIVQRIRSSGLGGYDGVRTNDQKRETGSKPSRA